MKLSGPKPLTARPKVAVNEWLRGIGPEAGERERSGVGSPIIARGEVLLPAVRAVQTSRLEPPV